jgi:hypothetical protein
MKRWSIYVVLCLVCIICRVNAFDTVILKKYPHTLLTNDYGILKESDLKVYNSSTQVGVNTWQCFPTAAVSVNYEDSDYDSDLKLRFAALKITVRLKGNIVHEYELTRGLPVDDCKDKQDLWRRLMRDEKYVCVGGGFVDYEEHVKRGTKQQIYGWIFDRIKTKKGCDAYHANCGYD